jgi:hypothetical protein
MPKPLSSPWKLYGFLYSLLCLFISFWCTIVCVYVCSVHMWRVNNIGDSNLFCTKCVRSPLIHESCIQQVLVQMLAGAHDIAHRHDDVMDLISTMWKDASFPSPSKKCLLIKYESSVPLSWGCLIKCWNHWPECSTTSYVLDNFFWDCPISFLVCQVVIFGDVFLLKLLFFVAFCDYDLTT